MPAAGAAPENLEPAFVPQPSSRQKALVRESFDVLLPCAGLVAQAFYRRLFELDPKLEALFKGDLESQGEKLMNALHISILSLDRMDVLRPTIRLLGIRHREYGVQRKDYVTVAAALLWTLEQCLNERFTRDVKDAWGAVYLFMATIMEEA